MSAKSCCFFGHRNIDEPDALQKRVRSVIEGLIVEGRADTFLFGSRSQFDSLCLKIVTEMQEKYPHIKRIYVRAEFPHISERYKSYLLESYDDTYFPSQILGAGRAAYVERNFEMIAKSAICIVYYRESAAGRKSGTKIALNHAIKQKREIIRV